MTNYEQSNLTIENFKNKLAKIEIKRSLLREERKKYLEESMYFTKRHDLSLQARAFAQHVAQKIQSSIEICVNSICTLALQNVFYDDPYEFVTRFVARRGRLECDRFFSKEGNEIDPMESCSYGACNTANVSYRISLWSLNSNRPCFVFDEPLKDLSKDRSDDSSKMWKEICDKFKIQIIMISHDPEIINYADNVIKIEEY